MLAQVVDPKVQVKALEMGQENPLWIIVGVLVGILVLAALIALWLIRVKWPDDTKARAAAEAARDARHDKELAARKEENDLNRQLYQNVAIAAIATAQDNARASISEVTKEIGERVRDVKDEITASHDTSRQIQRSVAALLARLGVVVGLIGLLGFNPKPSNTSESAESVQPDMAAPVVVADARPAPPQPPPDPMICNPRCPAGQQCMGSICTVRVRPKQPHKPKPVRKVAAPADKPKPAPLPGPTSWNIAVVNETWTDGSDPFAVQPEDYR
jgi:flagellar basal body-associated protein FliL